MPILSCYLCHIKIVVHFDSCDSTLTYINHFFLFASFPSVHSDHPELRMSITGLYRLWALMPNSKYSHCCSLYWSYVMRSHFCYICPSESCYLGTLNHKTLPFNLPRLLHLANSVIGMATRSNKTIASRYAT